MGNQAIVRHGAYLVAVVLLCAPAIWNGFPLMFDDVGGYLERWPTASLALGRSTVYGSLVWFTSGTHFIPAIVVQALITVFVVDVAVKVFLARNRPPWLLTTIIAAMAAITGVAMFVSKVMPDAWAAPGVLGLYLLAWHTESLTNCERAVLVAIVAFAGAAHLATFGVLAGLSIVYVAAWLAGRWLGTTPEGMGVAIAAVWSGLLLLLVGNFIVAGRPTLPAEGDIFLLGRMIADGMADQVLAEECPRPDWQLCDYRNALPSYQEAFIFDSDSPLQKIGGEHDPRAHREITSIIAQSLTRHPIAHAERAVTLTAAQFVERRNRQCHGAADVVAYPLGVDAFHALAGGPFRRRATADRHHRFERLEQLGRGSGIPCGVVRPAGDCRAAVAVRSPPRGDASGIAVARAPGQCRDLRHHDRFA